MRFMLRRNIRELDLPNATGEMLEWLKRHAWKACKLQKGFRGSNPRLSAKIFSLNGYPSLLEESVKGKALNKVPAAACGDYEGIPGEGARGRLWGLRRNNRSSPMAR